MRYYLSGKVTGDPNYMQKFEDLKRRIREIKGEAADIINPAKILESVEDALSWNECMIICLSLLDMADVIILADDWKDSKGACIEYGYAIAKGITVEVRY